MEHFRVLSYERNEGRADDGTRQSRSLPGAVALKLVTSVRGR